MTNTIKNRLWINLALAACVAILTLILWLNPGKTPPQSVSLSNLEKAEVQSIHIRIGANPPIILQRGDMDWRLTQPFDIAANTSRVNAILNLLTTHAFARYPADELELEEFGLLPPAAVLRFDGAEFDFGATDPLSRKRYVLHNDALYLVEDFIYPLLSTNIGGLVSNKVIPATSTITGFELRDFSLTRGGSGGWTMLPDNPNLSADDLQEWINEWLNAQAIFVQYRPLPDLDDNQFVTLHFENGDSIRYRVLNDGNEPGLYRSDLGLRYSLNREIFNGLITGPLPIVEEFDHDSMIKADARPPGAST